MKNILIVSADSKESQSLCAFARRLGYSSFSVPDCREALTVTSEQKIDAVILDMNVTDRDFCLVMDKYLEHCRDIPMVLISSAVESTGDIEMMYSGIKLSHMRKPVVFDEFIRKTNLILKQGEKDCCEDMQTA